MENEGAARRPVKHSDHGECKTKKWNSRTALSRLARALRKMLITLLGQRTHVSGTTYLTLKWDKCCRNNTMKLQQSGAEVRHGVTRFAHTMHTHVARSTTPTGDGFVTTRLCPIKDLVPNTSFLYHYPVDGETNMASGEHGGDNIFDIPLTVEAQQLPYTVPHVPVRSAAVTSPTHRSIEAGVPPSLSVTFAHHGLVYSSIQQYSYNQIVCRPSVSNTAAGTAVQSISIKAMLPIAPLQ